MIGYVRDGEVHDVRQWLPASATADVPIRTIGELLAAGESHVDEHVRAVAANTRAHIGQLRDLLLASPPPDVAPADDVEPETTLSRQERTARERAARPLPPARVIRAWARQEGIDVPVRGTLPDDVLDAYSRTHPPTDSTEESAR